MHPDHFKKALKQFDPKLDFEWNGQKGQWEVVGRDRKGIKYLIKAVPLGKIDELGPHIIEELWSVTPHRQGGAEVVNRMIDDINQEDEARIERDLQTALDGAEAEAYTCLQRRNGNRVSVDGFKVTDKRRVKLGVV